jgi:flagellar hook assembly protein FlgD
MEKEIETRFEIRIIPVEGEVQLSAAIKETIQLITDGSGYQLIFNLDQKNNVRIELLNALGQTVKTEELQQMEKGNYRISSDDLKQGSYLVRVSMADANKVFRVIK